MKRYLPLILGFVLLEFSLHAQNYFASNDYTPGNITSALTGYEMRMLAQVNYRSIWTGLDNAPATGAFAFHYAMEKDAFGLQLQSDHAGPMQTNGITLQYARKIPTAFGNISGGAKVNYDLNKIALLQTSPYATDDPLLQANEAYSEMFAGLSAAWSGNKGYVGLEYGLPIVDVDTAVKNTHLVVAAAYTVSPSTDIDVYPSLLYRYRPDTPQIMQLQAHVVWRRLLDIYAGFSGSSTVQAGFRCYPDDRFILGYLFEYNTALRSASIAGGHEIVLAWYLRNSN